MKGFGVLAAFVLAGVASAQSVTVRPDNATKLRQVGAEILFWSQQQRDQNFREMEKTFPGHIVKAGTKVRLLPNGKPLPIADADVKAGMADLNVAGLIVVQDGKVRLERYGLGFGPQGRWTFTSTLVGAAIRDGYIKSIDDPVTRYIPDLAGGGYDGVTIRQLLTMTSGVKWNEDYTDPKSDVARMFSEDVPVGQDPTVWFMKKLPRESEPGTKWVYKTGETNLIGVLVERATKKTLADYLTEKVWKPWGMERDAFWMTNPAGSEVSGCCLSVSLRDYARMGMFALSGGKGVVPDDWFAKATVNEIPQPAVNNGYGYGYGYQWWTMPNGRFAALGIFGQSIMVDPAKKLVVVMTGSWPTATGETLSAARAEFWKKIETAAD
jgi:CubicO group peptidase (beta-lactamase class C family)